MAKSKQRKTGRPTGKWRAKSSSTFKQRETVMRVVDAMQMVLGEIEDARKRGDSVKITRAESGGISLEITSRKTKPEKPNSGFPYGGVLEPALLAKWTGLGMKVAVVTGTLPEDGSTVFERAYVTAPMVAVATARSRRMVDRWAADGKFVPAHQIGNERLWAADDLDRLLREGRFFEQSVFDKGHAGELVRRIREAQAAHTAEQAQEAQVRVRPARQAKKEERV
jgi:hypothetical protein